MKFSGTPGTVVAALLASASLGVSASTEHYAESLSQFMLADSKVLSRFSFDTTTTLDRIYGTQSAEGIDIRTSDAFPRAVSSVIRAYGVGELHLSLTSGRWDYGRWETPEALGTTARPPGAELQAWLQEDSKWNGLTHALSGLFCTSLAKMDAEHTVRPLQSFQPASPHLTGSHTLQHALLPLEHPCTENLTPFISLLPCRNLAGLASLPDPHFLFDANYQSMSVHITTNEADQIALSLQVEVVSDPVRMERKQGGKGRRDWSHKSLFGRELQNLCPVSQSTDLSVKMGAEQLESTTLKPGLEWWQQSTDGSALRKELGTDDLPIRLSTQWKGESFFTYRAYLMTFCMPLVLTARPSS